MINIKPVNKFQQNYALIEDLHLLTNLSNKKIAIVANTCWNIYNFRTNIISRLLELNAKVYIIAPIDETIQFLSKLENVTIVPLNNLKRNSSNPFSELALFNELYKKYKKINPDFILHYTIKPNIYGSVAAGLMKIKSASVVTGLGYTFIHKAWMKKIVSKMYKFAFGFNDYVIFENQDDRLLFIESEISSSLKSISVKGCGVNLNHFKTEVNRLDRDGLEFIFVGRLLYDKGIVEYIESAKYLINKYPDVKFTVLGLLDEENPSHVSREKLLTWIKSNAIQYYSETKDVRPFLEKADCIVLPSYREGLPKVIIESMAMSLPVITTDTAGCRETVEENYNGFLVPPKNTEKLIEAMEKFINLSQGARFKMGQRSLQKVNSEFKDTTIANDILSIVAHAFV